mgnify:CR=1 FL=1
MTPYSPGVNLVVPDWAERELEDFERKHDAFRPYRLHVPYDGAALQPGQRCHWRVRTWDERDAVSEWSEAAWWEMGLLEDADWQAEASVFLVVANKPLGP